jgi:PAS domain S-box-containing protein
MSNTTAENLSLNGNPASELSVLRGLIDLVPDFVFVKDTEGRFLISNQAHVRLLGANSARDILGKTDSDFYPKEVAQKHRQEELRIIQSGEAFEDQSSYFQPVAGEARWLHITKAPMRGPDGKVIGLVGIGRDITARKKAEEELCRAHAEQEQLVAKRTEDLANANRALQQQIQERDQIQMDANRNYRMLRALVDNLPDMIFIKDTESRFILLNQACAVQLGMSCPEEAVGKTDADFVTPELAQRYRADEVALMQSGKPVHQEEPTLHKDSGKMGSSLTTKLPVKDADGKVIGLMGIARDITPLKEAEMKLEAVHKELVHASRAAGMAEVAIGVLHNVGNVLNGVNVSAGLICERLRSSKLSSLAKLTDLLQKQGKDLARFLSEDERGRQIVPYMEQLTQHLQQEQDTMAGEVKGLVSKIEHIKEIVSAQQNYARVCGVAESVALEELAEDALKIHGAAYERHGVSVVREFDSIPVLSLDKHKVLQILVNLLHNAKYACDASNRPDKQVAIRIKAVGGNRVRIQVSDNGIGIPPENMKRMFTQGFTTRKGGHGFGLHSGALAARELGGSLTVHSDGADRGATFTLELPMTPAQDGGSRND